MGSEERVWRIWALRIRIFSSKDRLYRQWKPYEQIYRSSSIWVTNESSSGWSIGGWAGGRRRGSGSRGKWDGRCPEDTFFDVLPLTTMRSSSDYPICQTGNLSYLYLFIFDVFQPIWHLWFYSLWGKQGKGCSAHVGQGSAMMRTQSPCLVFFKTLPPGAGLGLKPMQFWVPSLRERIQKYLMFANITKTYHHVNTWLGPLLRPSEGVMWAQGPEC